MHQPVYAMGRKQIVGSLASKTELLIIHNLRLGMVKTYSLWTRREEVESFGNIDGTARSTCRCLMDKFEAG